MLKTERFPSWHRLTTFSFVLANSFLFSTGVFLSLILVIGSVGVARAASIGSPAPFNIKKCFFFRLIPAPLLVYVYHVSNRALCLPSSRYHVASLSPTEDHLTRRVLRRTSVPRGRLLPHPNHLSRAVCFVNNTSVGRLGTANLRTVRRAYLFGGRSLDEEPKPTKSNVFLFPWFCFPAAVVATILRLCPWCDFLFFLSSSSCSRMPFRR